MIRIEGTTPPVILELNGKTYVCPTKEGWTQVPNGTTLNDIEWICTLKPRKAVKPVVARVKSSDGKKVYLVTTFADGRQTCSCPGFTYRRFCKHTGATNARPHSS